MKKQKYTGSEQHSKKESQDKKGEDETTIKEKNDKEKVNFEQTALFEGVVLRLEPRNEIENRQQTNTVEKEFNSRYSNLRELREMTSSTKDVPALVQIPKPTFIKKLDRTKSIYNRHKEYEVKENKNINESKERDIKEDIPIYQESTKAKFEEEERNPIEINSVQYSPIQNLEKLLDSVGVIVLMIFATIFVLVGDDIKTLSLTYIVDQAFDYTKTACFGLFLLEIILTCIAKKGYSFSFFFYVDIISTLSLIQDIDFMINPLIALSDS